MHSASVFSVIVGLPSAKAWWFDDVENIQAQCLNYDSMHNETLTDAVYPQLVVPMSLLNTLENGYRISAKAYKAVSPVMLIWGRGDVFGTGPDEKLLKKLQNVEVHYLTSSHMCMETMPQEISEYLNGWFTFTAGRQKPPANGKKAK